MKLLEVWIRAKPTVQHPGFWKIQFGYLIFWLMAEDTADAIKRAETIIDQLPFEIVGRLANVKIPNAKNDAHFPEYVATSICSNRESAELFGFAHVVLACPPGADESGFDTEFERDGLDHQNLK